MFTCITPPPPPPPPPPLSFRVVSGFSRERREKIVNKQIFTRLNNNNKVSEYYNQF